MTMVPTSNLLLSSLIENMLIVVNLNNLEGQLKITVIRGMLAANKGNKSCCQ